MVIKNENEQTSITKSVSYLASCLCTRKIFCRKSTTFTRLRLRTARARRIVSSRKFRFQVLDHTRSRGGDRGMTVIPFNQKNKALRSAARRCGATRDVAMRGDAVATVQQKDLFTNRWRQVVRPIGK